MKHYLVDKEWKKLKTMWVYLWMYYHNCYIALIFVFTPKGKRVKSVIYDHER